MGLHYNGRALFLHRDSGGKAEMAPAEYVAWAQGKAHELKLSFDGTPDRIEAMIRQGRYADGDIFLDYDVKGNILSRDGLNALTKESLRDPSVTHILIPRRDRLARPDDPIDGVRLENAFRTAGKTIVYMTTTLAPLKRGGKADVSELIMAVVDFDRAEKDRRDLAEKIIYAQLRLAKLGYSIGGRAPYGFRRWLVKDDGTQVRELTDGERVRMAGHHVVWLPTAEPELAVIREILTMLETMPASRVAADLTARGIPSPDYGRSRKDRGVKHLVSGVWHQTTIVNIARNPLLMAVASFGLRSMGDKLRFAPDGPRELGDSDFRNDDKPKIIRNPENKRITAPASFEPLVDAEKHRQLIAKLDARAGTQRGKPRAHDPKTNPLGGQIFDMNCGWPMYRMPYNGSFRYGCGCYQQSHGAVCDHNHVPGPLAAAFTLSCLRQKLSSPALLARVERRFRELATQDEGDDKSDQELKDLRVRMAEVQTQLKTVSNNMALAKTAEQFEAISAIFQQLTGQEKTTQAQIVDMESQTRQVSDVETEVAGALNLVRRLTEIVSGSTGLDIAGQAVRLANARLFLRFQQVQVQKRLLNKVAGGVVVFGDAPNPIEIYRGPTGRRALNYNGSTAMVAAEPGKLSLPSPPESTIGSGSEGNSLRNVSRGDRT